KVEARRDKHDADTKDVFVMIGNAEDVTLKPNPRLGAVSIMTEPFEASGAEIWIDGEKTEYKTPAVLELLEGEYIIRLVKAPFNDETISISIEKGQEVSQKVAMSDKPLKGTFPLETVHCIEGGTKVVEVTNPKTGRTWIDRNLGAERAATSPTDEKAYGDLYQWGRYSDGHQCRDSETTSSVSSSTHSDHNDFITTSSNWLSSQNNDLWQGVNGVNNPCHEGYRLPTEAEFNTERLSWSSKSQQGAFNSPLKLTAGGYRLLISGALTNVGSVGYYWSSTVTGAGARGLVFNSSLACMGVNGRAFGGSVRCIKD
ncbi:MAG: PEGA domain-containing protein, partial [Cryomorphaceae bacterium]